MGWLGSSASPPWRRERTGGGGVKWRGGGTLGEAAGGCARGSRDRGEVGYLVVPWVVEDVGAALVDDAGVARDGAGAARADLDRGAGSAPTARPPRGATSREGQPLQRSGFGPMVETGAGRGGGGDGGGTARKIEDNPKELLELYRGITNDDCRTIQRGKIRNIQLPAIKYFAYYIGTSILGRENTSNISSYHLGFLIAALTGDTPYHLGALVARRLSNKGPIFGGIIASRVLAYLELPLDPNDVKITPMRLDIAAMKSHQFVTTDSSLDKIVYRILFADGEEREILLPQPDLFSIDRKPWSRTKEEVDEKLKIQGFHQQHDSEDAEPSYDYTVTYPGASSSTYPEYDPSPSYYGGATSWAPWD
ncbi:hypothetical protein QYE76_015403 [Lolium multiflorum]|uniref:Uncharacterized protein n=1 Tax=Lolium multiflorum TaxID=4521 RepID=A0AAD8U2H4_LOLMU|nr:hypothetical protein QYE76_015403 [Lolium multiflorum]